MGVFLIVLGGFPILATALLPLIMKVTNRQCDFELRFASCTPRLCLNALFKDAV